MAAGRCEGCGFESASCLIMRNHQSSCDDYAALYRKDPALALDPAESLRRHREEKHDPQRQAEARSVHLTQVFADNDRFRQKEARRWAEKDILA